MSGIVKMNDLPLLTKAAACVKKGKIAAKSKTPRLLKMATDGQVEFSDAIKQVDDYYDRLAAQKLQVAKTQKNIRTAVIQAAQRGYRPTAVKALHPSIEPIANYIEAVDRAQARQLHGQYLGAVGGLGAGAVGGAGLGKLTSLLLKGHPKARAALLITGGLAGGLLGGYGGRRAGKEIAARVSAKKLTEAKKELDPGRVFLRLGRMPQIGSNGQGRGLATGMGRGPIGIPIRRKIAA